MPRGRESETADTACAANHRAWCVRADLSYEIQRIQPRQPTYKPSTFLALYRGCYASCIGCIGCITPPRFPIELRSDAVAPSELRGLSFRPRSSEGTGPLVQARGAGWSH